MFSIFTYIMSRVTHSEPRLPMIHHNQLLFTKFGKNLRHIESMTSKVQSTENY